MEGNAYRFAKSGERRIEANTLLKELGPIGMAKYLEKYDNGGTGDYTKEKYDQPDYSIEEILAMSK